jgi:hypothetical protein
MGAIQPNQRPTKKEQVRSPTPSTPTPRYTGEPPLARNPPASSEPRQKQIHPPLAATSPSIIYPSHHPSRHIAAQFDTSCQTSFVVEMKRGRAHLGRAAAFGALMVERPQAIFALADFLSALRSMHVRGNCQDVPSHGVGRQSNTANASARTSEFLVSALRSSAIKLLSPPRAAASAANERNCATRSTGSISMRNGPNSFRQPCVPPEMLCSSAPDEHNHEGGNHGTQLADTSTLRSGVRGR